MSNERASVAQTDGQNAQLYAVENVPSCFDSAAHNEAQHSAKTTHLLSGNVVSGMAWKTRIENLFNLWMVSEKLGDSHRIVIVPLHPKW